MTGTFLQIGRPQLVDLISQVGWSAHSWSHSAAGLSAQERQPGGKVRLQPANINMHPIVVPAKDVHLQGCVIGVLRRY